LLRFQTAVPVVIGSNPARTPDDRDRALYQGSRQGDGPATASLDRHLEPKYLMRYWITLCDGLKQGLNEMPFEAPYPHDPERQAKIGKILQILDRNPEFQPFRDHIRIFGGVARGNPAAGDVDIMLDYSTQDDGYYSIPGINIFLSLAKSYYGYVDVFVKTKTWMVVRNEYGNGWEDAKGARMLWKAARTEGRSLDDVLIIWQNAVAKTDQPDSG
jgi:hypothetical protein